VTSPRIHRLERFGAIDSTQRIVAAWLEAGEPEICVAVADEQTAGRGRRGRAWAAPPGAGLLQSIGFRPDHVPLRHGWRLAARVALAMAEAAEATVQLPPGTIRLKWPNDLVVDGPDGEPRKLAGVLGETVAASATVDRAVVGIGLNADWPRTAFPPELAATMTSLRDTSGHAVGREAVLDAFLGRLLLRYPGWDGPAWEGRQRTTGAIVDVATVEGVVSGRATGLDGDSGALLLDVDGRSVSIDSGDVVRCRVIVERGV
jgi:BirA family biotin operon repressor/biotin-[acetyl-CoA-carboxylase] ligase